MKFSAPLLIFLGMTMLCLSLLSCRKTPKTSRDDPHSTIADTISDHLKFSNATKKQGTIPHGPAGNSLKISFRDTLYLADELLRPIKFLHEDTTKNVAGVYLQVHTIGGSSFGYYDVPEVPEAADSDTVSVIMIGINPDGLIDDGVPPAGSPVTFTITIVPHDETGAPIAEATRPVKLSPPIANPDRTEGSCGLVTSPGDYWDWEMSYIAKPDGSGNTIFLNSPDVIWGINGQDIKGSCCNGNSVYGFCPGDTVPNAMLHFNTFFNYTEEVFKFLEDGTFVRLTGMFSSDADPNASDFCGSGDGVIHENLVNTTYNGNWTISPYGPFEGDSLYLTLQGTSSTGGGYGNPGGRIHILDCFLLMLIQPDREVPDRDLVKIYNYRNVNSPYWYPFN